MERRVGDAGQSSGTGSGFGVQRIHPHLCQRARSGSCQRIDEQHRQALFPGTAQCLSRRRRLVQLDRSQQRPAGRGRSQQGIGDRHEWRWRPGPCTLHVQDLYRHRHGIAGPHQGRGFKPECPAPICRHHLVGHPGPEFFCRLDRPSARHRRFERRWQARHRLRF